MSYWNAYVANLQMHGQGTFVDPRLDDAKKFPVAARAKLGHKRDPVDRITPGSASTIPGRALAGRPLPHHATLAEVVEHYDRHFGLRLTEQEKIALIEFLKSI